MPQQRITYREHINKALKAFSQEGVEQLSFANVCARVQHQMEEHKKMPGNNFETLVMKALMYHRKQKWVVYDSETQSMHITPYGRNRLIAPPSKNAPSQRKEMQLLRQECAALQKYIRAIKNILDAYERGTFAPPEDEGESIPEGPLAQSRDDANHEEEEYKSLAVEEAEVIRKKVCALARLSMEQKDQMQKMFDMVEDYRDAIERIEVENTTREEVNVHQS